MILTREFIESGGTLCGINPVTGRKGYSWNKQQFEALGVPYPPEKGWMDYLLGKEIPDDNASVFLSLKGFNQKKQKAALRNQITKEITT
jgi:hypothetical protein